MLFRSNPTILLGSKELGTNVLKLHFVMLVNHDQNVLVYVLNLLKLCLYVKLESSVLARLIDRKLDSINQSSCRLFFYRIF